jgi:KUP system potassium uptake protein
MTRQAIQLGWCPRLRITQTSKEGYGQIYVGMVNWMLMLVTIGLTLAFGKSDNLAAAYGIAVSLTMLLTCVLLFIAMREIWHWPLAAAGPVIAFFLIIDGAFVISNGMKFFEGGWVPLLLAVLVWGGMAIWHRGMEAVNQSLRALAVPIDTFLADIAARGVPRVPGTAVFLTRALHNTPPVMLWHVRNNRSLHKNLIALTATTASVPFVDPAQRVEVEPIGPGFWRMTAHYGFMERPNIPELLQQGCTHGCDLPIDDVTYYVGHETVLHRLDGHGIPLWMEQVFSFMLRNSTSVASFFHLPRQGVVEIGRQVEI